MINKFNPNTWIYYLMGYIVGTLLFGIWSFNGEYLSVLKIIIDIVLCVFNGYMLFKFFGARRTIKRYKDFINHLEEGKGNRV